MARSLGPGRGGPKSAGLARRCASPGNAASTSALVMPQRAVLQTGGGAGSVVVVVVVAATVLGGAGGGLGACSFARQAARRRPKTRRPWSGRQRVGRRLMGGNRIASAAEGIASGRERAIAGTAARPCEHRGRRTAPRSWRSYPSKHVVIERKTRLPSSIHGAWPASSIVTSRAFGRSVAQSRPPS